MPQLRDHFGDLEAGKLASFAWLGALSHLDLKLATVVQILRRHSEAAGRDLFDRRVGIVSIWLRAKARRILSAFTGVRFGADAVHGNAENLVCLGRQRSQ